MVMRGVADVVMWLEVIDHSSGGCVCLNWLLAVQGVSFLLMVLARTAKIVASS